MSEINTANSTNTSSAGVSPSPINADSIPQTVSMMKRKHDEEDSAPPEYKENFQKATQEEIANRV